MNVFYSLHNASFKGMRFNTLSIQKTIHYIIFMKQVMIIICNYINKFSFRQCFLLTTSVYYVNQTAIYLCCI